MAFKTLADEIIGALKHYIRPIRIDEDTLALDLINQVGPGGNFLAETHTIKHIKSLWQPLGPQVLGEINEIIRRAEKERR